MSLLRRDASQIESEMLDVLARGTSLTNVAPGSRIRLLTSATAMQIGLAHDAVRYGLSMSRAGTAVGFYLDAEARNAGVTRQPAQKAFTTAEEKNLKVFVVSGTLAAALPSKSIPIGTTITTADGTIGYSTTTLVTFDDVTDHVYLSAVADAEGRASNVGRGLLNTHTLGASITVSNLASIENGSDIETDASLRHRLQNAASSRRGANQDAVRAAALARAGIADIRTRQAPEGPGTFEVLVIPTGNDVPESAIAGIQATLSIVAAAGVKIVVRTPTLIPIQIVVRISTVAGTTPNDKQLASRAVESAILTYLGQLTFESTLVVNELHERIQGASEMIFDHRLLCMIVDGEERLFRNIKLGPDELFVPDPRAFDRAVDVQVA
jgi:uncharacterized phage protein gp47/JayE